MLSPSASRSPSASTSLSPSVSTSASASPSRSPSTSLSPSASTSVSPSSSLSPSSSRSPSLSASASPSAGNQTSLYVTVAGVHYATDRLVSSQKILHDTLTITDTKDQPKRCTFTTKGFLPTEGQEVTVSLGGKRLFGGVVMVAGRGYVGTPANYNGPVDASGYGVLLNQKKVIGRFQSTSATTIVQYLIANYAPGFTVANVALALASIDEITFTNQDVSNCLTQIASRIGAYWYVDDYKDVHFFLSEANSPATPKPVDLTTSHDSLQDFTYSRNISQVVTRVSHEGGGATADVAAGVGATTIRVTDAAWYSASGGSVVSGPQIITYTGKTSGFTAGTSWVTRTPASSPLDWRGIAWSPTLNLFCAVAAQALATAVMTSPDGVTWTTRTPAENNNWEAVIWVTELALFVAVASTGTHRVMTSPDGITWTARTAAAATSWQALTWSPALSLIVAVAAEVSSAANAVMSSPDGITWTSRTASSTGVWYAVAWAPSLSRFCAVQNSGGAMTSPDGITWTARTGSGGYGLAWSPTLSLFVSTASSGGAFYSSPDGITWTQRTDPTTNFYWKGIIWIEELGLFVAVSTLDSAADANQVCVSSDGLSWASSPASAVGSWNALAWSPALGIIVAVGGTTGTEAAYVMTQTGTPYGALTGIPASGTGAIRWAIKAGDPVNLRVQVNDVAAQTALAALLSSVLGTASDGIVEEVLQDGRLSSTEATARATAFLTLRKDVQASIQYQCRDIDTRAGRTVTVNLGSPLSVAADFKIQSVTFRNFHPVLAPDVVVQASSDRFSLENLLQLVVGTSTAPGATA